MQGRGCWLYDYHVEGEKLSVSFRKKISGFLVVVVSMVEKLFRVHDF